MEKKDYFRCIKAYIFTELPSQRNNGGISDKINVEKIIGPMKI